MNFKPILRKAAAKLGLPDEDGSIWYVVALMGGAIVLIAYFSIIPLIGYNLDSAVTLPANSSWNASAPEGAGIVTGAGLWSSLGPIAKTAAIVAGIAAMIMIIMTMAGGMGRRQ